MTRLFARHPARHDALRVSRKGGSSLPVVSPVVQAEPLRVLIANGDPAGLERMGILVSRLGHFPIACELGPESVAAASSERRPDVALVGVDVDERHGLEAISEIVRQASCPVIALLETHSPERVAEAAERGIFAYVVDADEDDLRGALEVTLRRFSELEALRRAFGRRATIEQAKGILMARHAVDEHRAFDLLRAHSQRSGRKVAELAEAIVNSHALLLQPPELGNSDNKLAKSDSG